MFVQDRNEEMETWEGKRLGQSGAVEKFEAEKAYSYQDYKKILPNLLSGYQNVYCDYSSPNFEKYEGLLVLKIKKLVLVGVNPLFK